ncbi:MAG: hypothetical protein COS89_08750, partial [Deltaproteobacteria bacterium CG07_land_8_20_14_0_80_38_7]
GTVLQKKDASILVWNSYPCSQFNRTVVILLNDMDSYVAALASDGELIISGFYVDDLEVIKEKARLLKLQYVDYKEEQNWVAVKFRRK